ncbi:hypothetical protein [Ornithinimicrobium cavernae]|uniref:hypothetical protein n=1 Tax=Ornithinimicrobium cavernae TaxID=2666047 RepID=UPI000D69DBE4|nr:hypothetical protein [Ornithinimicrobium cavernae]
MHNALRHPRSRDRVAHGFTVSSSHYWPRIDRSLSNLLFGFAMLGPGLYLILNDLPHTSSYLSQIVLSGMPTTLGGISIIFGCIGMTTGLAGAARKGDDAIDLELSSQGITVQGGYEIPWEGISHVTSITYYNRAPLQISWDRADLNRAFVLHLKEHLGIPRIVTKDGVPELKVKVVHYPAVDYMPLHESVISQFERRRIPVDVEWKSKET